MYASHMTSLRSIDVDDMHASLVEDLGTLPHLVSLRMHRALPWSSLQMKVSKSRGLSVTQSVISASRIDSVAANAFQSVRLIKLFQMRQVSAFRASNS
jgi:hypothetical protein